MGNFFWSTPLANSRWREVSENVRRLAGEAGCPQNVRDQAETIRDLIDLAATWPVPSSLKLDDDIGTQLSRLCVSSGIALCHAGLCPPSGGGGSGLRCEAVLS